MKVEKLKKKKRVDLYSEEGIASWADTDRSRYRALAKAAKIAGIRAPEFWVRDGESRLIRFLDEDAVVSFLCYKMKLNGRWVRYTKPVDGKPDLFASKLGLRPGRVFVYRIIDIQGYVNKRGKKITNQGKFLVASNKMYEQTRLVARESELDLNEQNIKMSRSGSGPDTTHVFILKPVSPLTPEMKKAAASFPKWKDYFKPPTTSEQKSIIASYAPGGDDDDDEGKTNNPY
jgi:hypothetical protein